MKRQGARVLSSDSTKRPVRASKPALAQRGSAASKSQGHRNRNTTQDVDRHRLEARELIGLCRQRLHSWRVQLCERAGATPRQLPERALVQVL